MAAAPDDGSGHVLGHDIRTDSGRIKRKVGYMAQRFPFYENLPIKKNMTFAARLYLTFAMMLGVPLMQFILFDFAVDTDPKLLPAALVTTSQDHYTRAMVSAMELTFFFFLPSLLLSGFMFPFRGMPDWAQVPGEIFSLTRFLRAIRAAMLKGADHTIIAGELAALTGFVVAFAALALLWFRRTLD